ncbi:SH3 domain-binding glutamic acid-rich-like protein 3 isoform X1 [Stigmatopora nigra]
MGSIVYYYASVSGNMELKKRQQRIEMALDGKGIKYEKVDITASQEAKDKMRAIVGDPTALPPQICNGNQYCGECGWAIRLNPKPVWPKILLKRTL